MINLVGPEPLSERLKFVKILSRKNWKDEAKNWLNNSKELLFFFFEFFFWRIKSNQIKSKWSTIHSTVTTLCLPIWPARWSCQAVLPCWLKMRWSLITKVKVHILKKILPKPQVQVDPRGPHLVHQILPLPMKK